MSAPDDPSSRGTFKLDLATAYLAALARIVSWAVVSALTYRVSPAAFGLLALIRGTLGILNYTSFGLAPAVIRAMATAGVEKKQLAQEPSTPLAVLPVDEANEPVVMPYSLAYAKGTDPQLRVKAAGVVAAWLAGILAVGVSILWAAGSGSIYRIPQGVKTAWLPVLAIGVGLSLRLVSDVAGAVLQSLGKIWLDNLFLILTELIWVVGVALNGADVSLLHQSIWFFVASVFLINARRFSSDIVLPFPRRWQRNVDRSVVGSLFAFGSLITVAQLADYLYAPTDLFLINRLLTIDDLRNYAPLLQIDAGLLLLTTGLAAVLLPKSAQADAAGDVAKVRRYYVRGTLLSVALLTVATAVLWSVSPTIFRLWLRDPMPASVALLPLVLIHTVVGGASAVGRSVLLGVGKVRAFTIAVLVAGASNVVLSFVFVQYCGWGLRGIVLGTIIAVVGRCAVWMPWYVMRTLRDRDNPLDRSAD